MVFSHPRKPPENLCIPIALTVKNHYSEKKGETPLSMRFNQSAGYNKRIPKKEVIVLQNTFTLGFGSIPLKLRSRFFFVPHVRLVGGTAALKNIDKILFRISQIKILILMSYTILDSNLAGCV